MNGFGDLKTKSIYSSQKRKYDKLTSDFQEFFSKRVDVFNISAAIGLTRDKKSEVEQNNAEFRANQIDRDNALYIVMQYEYPNMSDLERYRELAKFAEFGVKVLYEHVVEGGTYNPEKLKNSS